MKILICPDSSKDSLGSAEICLVVEKSFSQQFDGPEITSIPMAD